MERNDPDAFITPWWSGPETEIVIDLVAAAEEDEDLAEEDIRALRRDVEVLRASLEGS